MKLNILSINTKGLRRLCTERFFHYWQDCFLPIADCAIDLSLLSPLMPEAIIKSETKERVSSLSKGIISDSI